MAHVLAKDLRDSVLQAALEGKITTTLESDTNPLESIKHFQKEKDILLQKKNMKDRNKFDSIKEEEILFEIPTTWQWIRINDIGIYKKGPFGSALTKGMFVPKNNESVKVYEQKNAIQKNWTLGEYYIKRDYYETKMSGFSVETGDIIVSCAGTIGETYIMPEGIETGIINQALMRMNIVPSVNIDYFMLVFEHILKEEARKNSGGTAIKNIPPFEVFKAMPIPLPPIEEQARIVAKVDELMAKIDEYEKLEKELTELKEKFPGEMRDAILQAAMSGKLSRQLDPDSSSLELVKKIDEIRINGIKNKTIRKTKDISKISEMQYDIPETWKQKCFGEITSNFDGNRRPISKNDRNNGIYPYYGATGQIDNVKDYIFDGEYLMIGEDGGNFFVNRDNSFIAKGKFWANNHVHVVQPIGINIKFLKYFLDSCNLPAMGLINGIAVPKLNQENLNSIQVPIPPIEEQQRIVDKLDKLLPMCNELVNLC